MSETLENGVFQSDQRTAALPSYSPYPSTYQAPYHQPSYNQAPHHQPSYNQAPHHQSTSFDNQPTTHHSADSAGWVDETPRTKQKHDHRTEHRDARREHREARREHRDARRQRKRERNIRIAVGTYHAAKTATMFIYNSVSGSAKKSNDQRSEAHLA